MTLKNRFNTVTCTSGPKRGYISVVIPVYNDPNGLEDTLLSLENQSLPKERYEVIVGNDAHLSSISQICKKYHAKEVYTLANKGSYTLRNMAVAASQGEYIAFTDADITVPVHWLEKILDEFAKGYDYIGGLVIIDPSKIKTLTNRFVSFNEFDGQMIFDKLHFTATANVAVKRTIFEKLGAFDRRLFSAGDYEFGDRVYRSRLFKMHFSKKITVVHPPRGYKAFLKKLKRIAGGERDLGLLYPNRFQLLKKSIYRQLREALYFPMLPKNLPRGLKIQLFFLGLWFQLYRAIHTIKNTYKK